MAASDIRAGKAFVELSLRDKFSKQLKSAQDKFKAFGESITGLGAKMAGIGLAIVTPLALAAKRFATLGDEVNKASGRTGIAVEQLSALKYAAEQSGASLEEVEVAVKKMSNVLFDAANGSKSANATLAGLGLTLKQLQGLTPDQQFKLIADRLSKIKDASAKAAIAQEIFGKAGTRLLPLLEAGAKGIEALEQRAKSLGLVMSKEDAEAATLFGDTLDDLLKQLNTLIFTIGSAVARALQPFADGAINIMSSIIAWTKENKSLVVSVLTVGGALIAGGLALVTLGTSISVLLSSLAGIKAGFAVVASVLGFALNPVVLLSVGLLALAGYLIYTSDIGKQALGFLGNKFGELFNTAKEAFDGIADALVAGDIGLAAKILWAGIKLAFVEGTQELSSAWAEFKASFVQVSAAAFYGTLEIYQNVKASLLTAFENTTAFLGDLWDGFIGTFGDLWNGAVALVTKGLNVIKGAFDDTFDVDAANAAAQKVADDAAAARAQTEIDKQNARESERKKAVDQIGQDKDKAVKDINDREQAVSAAASQNAKDDIAAIEAERAKLQQELDALRAQAAGKRKSKEAEGGPPVIDRSKVGDLEDILKRRTEAAETKKTVTAAGLFNVAGLQSLQGGGAQEDIKKNTAETARELKRLNQRRGLSFS